MQTIETEKAGYGSGSAMEYETDKARQGVTGHHVRYVLFFGLVSAVVGLAAVGIIFSP